MFTAGERLSSHGKEYHVREEYLTAVHLIPFKLNVIQRQALPPKAHRSSDIPRVIINFTHFTRINSNGEQRQPGRVPMYLGVLTVVRREQAHGADGR